uniref:Uncharacterized protein n=1 Tax=Arundo donax TaxID=35708 RepID=A0A0A9DMY7_ARUDO
MGARRRSRRSSTRLMVRTKVFFSKENFFSFSSCFLLLQFCFFSKRRVGLFCRCVPKQHRRGAGKGNGVWLGGSPNHRQEAEQGRQAGHAVGLQARRGEPASKAPARWGRQGPAQGCRRQGPAQGHRWQRPEGWSGRRRRRWRRRGRQRCKDGVASADAATTSAAATTDAADADEGNEASSSVHGRQDAVPGGGGRAGEGPRVRQVQPPRGRGVRGRGQRVR